MLLNSKAWPSFLWTWVVNRAGCKRRGPYGEERRGRRVHSRAGYVLMPHQQIEGLAGHLARERVAHERD